MRGVVRALLAAVLLAGAMLAGVGVAAAAPVAATGKALPTQFPPELRKFVAGTDEFKSGPWFEGACAAKGGDVGLYLAQMFPAEERLLYWQMSDEDKLRIWTGIGPAAQARSEDAKRAVTEGKEPAHALMPTVFPGDDESFAPRAGEYCAEDFQAWGTRVGSNEWGFGWSKTADAESKQRWEKLPNAGDVPNGAWADACGTPDLPSLYCMHAYFVDCDQVKGRQDHGRCLGWNESQGRLSIATAHWLKGQDSLLERAWDSVDLGTVAGLASAPALMFGGPAASAFSAMWSLGVVGDVVDFVEGAANPLDKLANAAHEAAVEFTTAVLTDISETAQFDPMSTAFVTKYAQAASLGVVVMAFMCVHTLWRSGRHGSPGQTWTALGVYLPWALTAQALAPGLAAFLLTGMNALAKSMADVAGADIGGVITGVQSMGTLTAPAFPGGAFVGVLVFGAMIVGAVALWVGQQMHLFGMWIVGVVTAISFGLWVSPKYRHKALRPLFVFFSIACSKVLVFVLLGAVFAGAGSVITGSGGGPMDSFNRVAYVAIAMLLAGFGVWALVKWVPFLPTSEDSQDFGSGALMSGAVVGGAGAAAAYFASGRRGGAGAATARAGQSGQRGQGGQAGPSGGAGQAGGQGSQGSQGGGQAGAVTSAWQTRAQQGKSATVGAGSAAGKATKAGAAAGAGVASGGLSLVAQVGTQAVQTGIARTRQAADQHRMRAEDTPDEDRRR